MASTSQNSGQAIQAVTPSKKDSGKISQKKKRKKYSAQDKIEILEQVDECKRTGQSVGEFLRKRGLYSSQVSAWRSERERNPDALEPKKRGPKALSPTELRYQIQKLERQLEREKKLRQTAEAVIDIQKKVSNLFGIPLEKLEEK